MVSRIALFVLAATCCMAQTRSAVVSWSASPSTGATYNILRSASPSGPWTTPLNASPQADISYTDTQAPIGSTVTYAVIVVVPCASVPTGTACGSSPPATATVTIPPQPTAVVTVTIAIQ
jgi:hypothetical protein